MTGTLCSTVRADTLRNTPSTASLNTRRWRRRGRGLRAKRCGTNCGGRHHSIPYPTLPGFRRAARSHALTTVASGVNTRRQRRVNKRVA